MKAKSPRNIAYIPANYTVSKMRRQRSRRGASFDREPAEAATSPALPIMHPYRLTDFTPLAGQISAQRFHDAEYDPVLSSLATHVVESEAPIADDLLVSRIAGRASFQEGRASHS